LAPGCATLVHGRYQEIEFNVQPPGSEVTIYKWPGYWVAGPIKSPSIEKVHRPEQGVPYLAVAWKEGYCPHYWVPEHGFSAMGVFDEVGMYLLSLIMIMSAKVDKENGSAFRIDEVPFRSVTLQEEPCGP
jgi:hypothetical protein